jgi:glycine C-acetyltransferase
MENNDEPLTRALSWSVADHQTRPGSSFSDRYAGLATDVANASKAGLWQYFRSSLTAVGRLADVVDEAGRTWRGINAASQDYLGLSADPRLVEAVVTAVRTWGVHSSGSPAMGGGSQEARRIEERVAHVLGKKHSVLFPTGWAAGYGSIAGLVRAHDYVVIDALAHNCLVHGTKASTSNISTFIHNSMESLEKRLQRIRTTEPDAAVLIVTESLFSMDSDGPDMPRLMELKKRFRAHLLLDIAHDFGVLGPEGAGLAAASTGYSDIDYVVGSFSKTFASIGGFFATSDLPSLRAIQGYSGSYTFSNYLVPGQLAALRTAMDIVFSPEGDERRRAVLAVAGRLRDRLASYQIRAMGDLSTMIPVPAGSARRGRLAYRALLEKGVVTNLIEFPAVRRGEARFRLQLTPHHTEQDADAIADAISAVFSEIPA